MVRGWGWNPGRSSLGWQRFDLALGLETLPSFHGRFCLTSTCDGALDRFGPYALWIGFHLFWMSYQTLQQPTMFTEISTSRRVFIPVINSIKIHVYLFCAPFHRCQFLHPALYIRVWAFRIESETPWTGCPNGVWLSSKIRWRCSFTGCRRRSRGSLCAHCDRRVDWARRLLPGETWSPLFLQMATPETSMA
jgi:hypothetical protein